MSDDIQPFVRVFQPELLRVLRDGQLTRTELGVLLWLIANANYSNTVAITVVALAGKLDRDRTTVSRALKTLGERDYVRRSRNERGVPEMLISPWIAWKGGANRRAAALMRWASAFALDATHE